MVESHCPVHWLGWVNVHAGSLQAHTGQLATEAALEPNGARRGGTGLMKSILQHIVVLR